MCLDLFRCQAFNAHKVNFVLVDVVLRRITF